MSETPTELKSSASKPPSTSPAPELSTADVPAYIDLTNPEDGTVPPSSVKATRLRRTIPLWSILLVSLIASALMVLSVFLYLQWSDERDLRRSVQQQLASMTQQKTDLDNQVASLQQQVNNLNKSLTTTQGRLQAQQQFSADVAEVADLLRTCVNDNGAFMRELSDEMQLGVATPYLGRLADQASSSCEDASDAYDGIVDDLRNAGEYIA